MRRKRKMNITGKKEYVVSNDTDSRKFTPEDYLDIGLPPKSKFKDSGTRSEFGTGAVRDAQDGKGRMDLMPIRALFEVAKVFEEGSKKYAAHNWRKGIPLSRFMDSGMRHAAKYLRGDRDEPHDAMACWNFLCLIETRMMIEEGLLPESLNDLIFNPLDINDNPLGIQETHPGDGYIHCATSKEQSPSTNTNQLVDAETTDEGY